MANDLKIESRLLGMIGEELYESSMALKYCTKDIGDQLVKENNGVKGGNSVTGLKPALPTVGTNADMSSYNFDSKEDSYSLTTGRVNTGFSLSSAEKTYKVGGESALRERFAMPHARRIARQMDILFFQSLAASGSHRVARGTYTNGLSFIDVANMNAALCSGLAPKDGKRIIAMSAYDFANVANDVSTKFNASAQITDAMTKMGIEGQFAGLNWYTTESLNSFSVASNITTAAVNDTVAEGDTAITLDTTAAGATGTIKAGQAFTIAGVKEIDPQTQTAKPQLKTFIVAADATVAGNTVTVTVTEPIYTTTTSNAKANCSALPANDAVVTFTEGAAYGKTGSMVYAWHPDAIVCASVELEHPRSEKIVETLNIDGLKIRLWEFANGLTDTSYTRLDIDVGFASIHTEAIASCAGIMV